jgi:hypothetical protein
VLISSNCYSDLTEGTTCECQLEFRTEVISGDNVHTCSVPYLISNKYYEALIELRIKDLAEFFQDNSREKQSESDESQGAIILLNREVCGLRFQLC